MVYFHGNGGTVGDTLHRVADFRSLGFSSVVVDYRGYGQSTPTFPQEDRLYDDALATLHYLVTVRGIEPQRILVYGHSLGGAIALDAVTRSQLPVAGLIMEGSFTSMLAMANHARKFSYLPMGWLLRQRFASIEKVPRLQVPVLFVHGTGDRTVPHWMSEALYAAAPEPKTLALIPDIDHDITESSQDQDLQILKDFIASLHLTAP